MEDCKSRFEKLLEAIDCERRSEEAFFSKLLDKTPVKEKVENGLAWYPVKFTGMYYAAGEMMEVKIRKKNIDDEKINHRFKVGVAVQIFHSSPDLDPIRGTISYMKKDEISVLCRTGQDVLEDFQSGLAGVELIYDDKPYQVMKSAIMKTMHSSRENIQLLKKILCHENVPDRWNENEPTDFKADLTGMNDSQKNAITQSLGSKYLSVIHGPPGTGKTTTLVTLAKNICRSEKRILVCASSNNAVDVLALRLHLEGLKVLRIGNITRVHDAMTDLTVAEKMRNHPDWGTIKKMRIQADQLERQARQFKRNFSSENREERKNLRAEARDVKAWAKELELRISQEIVDEAQIIATTLVSASHSLIEDLSFRTVIIDEASQALEAECWNAILKSERVILAGDHKQLPPTVKSDEARRLGMETTLLDKFTEILSHSHILNVQYRMHEHILGFSNLAFYQGLLHSAEHVKMRTLPGDTQPLVFIDTAGCSFDEVLNTHQKSYKNEGEYFILREYVEQKKEILLGASIGVISPYAEQVRYLNEMCSADEVFYDLDLEINTIDGFQGQEKDVMIVSLVRSNDTGEIGFLKDQRRLNVALTRARKKLIVIGDSSTIGQDKLYARFIDFVESCGGLDSAWNYMKY